MTSLTSLHQEWVYLAVILDAFSRKVVGWELDRNLTARLPIAALEKAIADRQPPPGVVHHSDRGVQYASGPYVGSLQKHGMIPSMSRPTTGFTPFSCDKTVPELHGFETLGDSVRARADSPSCLKQARSYVLKGSFGAGPYFS